MKEIFKFNLGDQVIDTFSKFKGNIEARTQCLNGCIQYLIQPIVDKEGKMSDACQIDEQNLKLMKKSPLKEKKDEPFTGGLRKVIKRA